jgi:hypothetical protein
MDFGKFLNNLDENKSFKRVSGRQLREAAGEDAASVAQGAQWYYVPAKEYGGFRHVVVENGANDWAVYYLENIGAGGAKADVSGMAGGGSFIGAQRAGVAQEEARDLQRLADYLTEGNFGNGEDPGVDLSGFAVQRKVAGDFATVLKECVNIVKQG